MIYTDKQINTYKDTISAELQYNKDLYANPQPTHMRGNIQIFKQTHADPCTQPIVKKTERAHEEYRQDFKQTACESLIES